MATDKQYNKRGITPDKAMAWIERRVAGKTVQKVSESINKSESTVKRYVADFDEFMQGSPEYAEAAERLVKMLPTACDVYERVMQPDQLQQGNPDVAVATNVLKAAGFMKERAKIEKAITDLSDDDLDDIERRIIDNAAKRSATDSADQEREETPED